jgi:[histone H3]-N6,N6-dimethyl-L-lysine4 FAD-dependent demethylase
MIKQWKFDISISNCVSLRKKVNLRSYDEDLMDDELFEKKFDGTLKKNNKINKDIQKETEIKAMIVLSLSFLIASLVEHEIQPGVVREIGGKEHNDYIATRNHIMALWRGNVRVCGQVDKLENL